jgi:hypothetical protein
MVVISMRALMAGMAIVSRQKIERTIGRKFEKESDKFEKESE